MTGEFIHCELGAGSVSDAKYLEALQNTLEKGDLSLKDLGYFKTEDLKFIEEMEAFYISRLKVNTNLYKKEEIIEYGFKGKVTIRGSKPKTPHFSKFEYIVKSLYHFSKTFPEVPYFGNVLTYVF